MSGPNKRRVVIDARMVGPIPHGFSRYVTLLAEGLDRQSQRGGLEYEPVFLVRPELRRLAPRNPVFCFGTCEVGARFLSPLELIEIPRVLRKLGAGLYHSPTFSSLIAAPCPWLVTVHDLNHLRFGGFAQKLYYERLLRPFAARARRLITVSEFSRGELATWLSRDASTIDIVPNAIDPEFLQSPEEGGDQAILERFGVERRKFFLCLTNSKPHKNLEMLIQAYSLAGDSGSPLWPLLVNVSGADGAPGLRQVGALPEADARALLRNAGAVVFPSLYEGFGLPPVEAAALGTPVIVSRIDAHREALSEVPEQELIWLAPTDAGAWALTLKRASASNGQGLPRPSLESRTRLQARYAVDTLGRGMDQIYRSVLG